MVSRKGKVYKNPDIEQVMARLFDHEEKMTAGVFLTAID
jgi:hypothetical protein